MEQRELDIQNKKDKGFTLVELLIVIVILGILATVTVLAVSGITGESKKSVCETNQAAVQTGIEAHYVRNNATYPGADATGIAAVASFVETELAGEIRDVDINPSNAGPAAAYTLATGNITLDCDNIA